MEDSIEWKLLKMCSDRMDLIITSSVIYSKNEYFCSIVIDGLLIAATKGLSLFETINATSKKAIGKIKDYSRPHMENCSQSQDATFYLDEEFHQFFPVFEQYIVNFKNHIASSSQLYETPNTYGQLYESANSYVSPSDPANWTWNSESYNPNYYLTKNYTTVTTVKMEPRDTKVVSRKMIHEGHAHIDQSNIGFKMLLGLGWSGGPLGANQDGISEPISVELRARRSGLGADRQSYRSAYGNITSDTFFQFLKGYADDDRQYEDLEFSDEFSNKEKKKLFGISRDLSLLHESEHRNGMLVVKIMKPKYNYH
ncbi:hypothetical protein HA402_003792 [Bradysia odoriphaga]|nr:hypothetical protein HA402_003792 [Bradysia odoriphaga]